MIATLFVAILSHPDRSGSAIGEEARRGAPLHFTMHARVEDAVEALNGALVTEWDEVLAVGLGSAARWDRAIRSRTMIERGYFAAVVEREVSL